MSVCVCVYAQVLNIAGPSSNTALWVRACVCVRESCLGHCLLPEIWTADGWMEKNNTTVIIKQLKRTCDWGAAEQYRAHLTSPKSKLTSQKQRQPPHFTKFDWGFWWRTCFVCLFACFSSGTGHHGWFDHVNSLDDGIKNVLVRTNVETTIIPPTSISKLDKNYIH